MIIYPKDLKAGIRCCGPEGCGEERLTGQGAIAQYRRFCIGAECAAWEWGNTPRRITHQFSGEPQVEEPPRPAYVPANYEWRGADDEICTWVEPDDSYKARWHGWCGLLGRRAEA